MIVHDNYTDITKLLIKISYRVGTVLFENLCDVSEPWLKVRKNKGVAGSQRGQNPCPHD